MEAEATVLNCIGIRSQLAMWDAGAMASDYSWFVQLHGNKCDQVTLVLVGWHFQAGF